MREGGLSNCGWWLFFWPYGYDETGIKFDIPPKAASPDDVADFIEKHPEMLTLI